MNSNSHNWVLNAVKDITVARMENTTSSIDIDDGVIAAEFMQGIYDKLVELVDKNQL